MSRLVVEKRALPRVDLAASGLLVHRDSLYRARLENISLAGALITLQEDEAPLIPRGGRCSLALYRKAGGEALRFSTKVVHSGFDMVCVKFIDMDLDTRLMLRSIIAHKIPEKAKPLRFNTV